jgi:hypothetical protein
MREAREKRRQREDNRPGSILCPAFSGEAVDLEATLVTMSLLIDSVGAIFRLRVAGSTDHLET